MKKLVSILLTLAVAVSLLVVPVAVSADAPEVTVPLEFSATGRPELKDGSVSLDGENLIVEFTAIGQNAKPTETNKYSAIWFDVNIKDKDLNYEDMFATPWDAESYVLVNNWYNAYYKDPPCPDSLSWRPSYKGEDGYENPWGSPVPSPTTIFFGTDGWPVGLSLISITDGDDIKWTATVPTSLLGVEPGDTFGMLVAARDQNMELDPTVSLNSWPALEYGYNAGYHLGNYALVTIPAPLVKMASFVIDHAKIDFKKKADADKVRVQGTLELDLDNGDGVVISDEVIVTVGPLSETITMELKGKKGEKWQYKRPKGGEGDIKKMTINWKNGKFDFSMDKVDLSGLTDPDEVTISIQIGDDLGEETITMREKKHHWDYKAK